MHQYHQYEGKIIPTLTLPAPTVLGVVMIEEAGGSDIYAYIRV